MLNSKEKINCEKADDSVVRATKKNHLVTDILSAQNRTKNIADSDILFYRCVKVILTRF